MIPGMLIFIAFLLWVIHAASRRQGRRSRGIQIAGYALMLITVPIAYFTNADYFDPIIFNADNYWNMRSRVALFAVLIMPVVLIALFALIDWFEEKHLAHEADDLGVDYRYGSGSLDDDDE